MNLNVSRVKICVTIPVGYTDKIREAICKEGAGQIYTNYTECSIVTKCIGTFRPNDAANPFIGEANKLEVIDEEKLEVICDIKLAKKVITKLREVHPYEEPAIDIYPLINEEDL